MELDDCALLVIPCTVSFRIDRKKSISHTLSREMRRKMHEDGKANICAFCIVVRSALGILAFFVLMKYANWESPARFIDVTRRRCVDRSLLAGEVVHLDGSGGKWTNNNEDISLWMNGSSFGSGV